MCVSQIIPASFGESSLSTIPASFGESSFSSHRRPGTRKPAHPPWVLDRDALTKESLGSQMMKYKFKCHTREKEVLRNYIQPPACFKHSSKCSIDLSWAGVVSLSQTKAFYEKTNLGYGRRLTEGTFGKK